MTVQKFFLPLLILLLHASLSAQVATRLGVHEGIGFTAITYDFMGRIHDRELESMPFIGLVVELPLSDNMLLSLRPGLTTLNGTAGLAARVQDAGGSTYYRSSIKEQWVLEAPVLAKYVMDGLELRPYFGLGGFIDYNASPAEIAVTKDSDASYSALERYPNVSGGVIAIAGVEIDAAPMLLISPELGVRQPLAPPIDTPILRQNNNPRFLFTIGIAFTLDREKWR